MKKIKDLVFKILYALPFGIKGGDKEIFNSNTNNLGNETTINQVVEDKTVAKHLLNGEVTQAVEELRYRTYKVEEESKNYQYIGNGIAVKKEINDEQKQKTRFRFSQRNKLQVTGVLDELERVDNYGKEQYSVDVSYSQYPKFNTSEFLDRVICDVDTKEEKYIITLVFSTIPNQYNKKSKPFVNELLKLKNINLESEYAVSHNPILSNITSIAFSTYKASGEEDFTNYAFMGENKVLKTEFQNNECFITFKWTEVIRFPLEKLSEKYASHSMSEKYENKVEKPIENSYEPLNKATYCEICGNEYVTSKVKGMCDECFEKMTVN